MSSRQKRLLAKQTDFISAAAEKEDASEESADDSFRTSSRGNPYALLVDDGQDGDAESPPPENDAAVATGAAANTSSKKRNKRRSKKKTKQRDDDLDAILRDINAPTPEESGGVASGETSQGVTNQPDGSVFALEVKSLTGEAELHRIFGAKVVAEVEAELQQRQRQEAGRRGRGQERRFVRKFLLSEPRPEWPPRAANLVLRRREDGVEFEYVAEEGYAAAHALFLECQDLGDPQLLGAYLAKHPFHVEALLAMYDVLTATGSHLHADECLNRALFALEAAWDRRFVPGTGRVRLPYEVEFNRLLFAALFLHVQRLNRRGCLRTAFEAGKLLLSLDRSDPLGVLCMIDYLALRAGQFEFVERMMGELPDEASLAVRPGTAFSLALCKQKRAEASVESLVQAVLMHPLALSRLIQKLKQSNVRVSALWDALLQKPFFARASEDGSASLNHLVNLFVERHHTLYKAPEVLEWLLAGAQQALNCATDGKPFQGATAADWTCVRRTAFPPDGDNHFSHLHLYAFSDDVSRLPQDVLQHGREEGLVELERRMAQELEQNGGMEGIVRLTPEELQDANPLVVLLRSLLPWVQADPQPREGHDG